MINPNLPVARLAGIGPKLAKRLENLDITKVEDLLYHFPTRFEDYSVIKPINKIQVGDLVTIKATVWQIKNNFTRRGFTKTTAVLADTTGTIEVIWFNQSWITTALTQGSSFQFSGKATEYRGKLVLVNPDYEEVGKSVNTARLIPVYSETAGISSKWLRTKTFQLLQNNVAIEEFLPVEILEKEKLTHIKEAIEKIHFPQKLEDAETARKRLAFDEIFKITLSTLAKKSQTKKLAAMSLKTDWQLVKKFKKSLPFKLTGAQEAAIGEVLADLEQSYPVQRLIEGDVGCGKTVVVATAILMAVNNRTSAIIAAPTEILAFQHAKNLKKMLEPFDVKVGIFTKSKKDKNAQVLVGTHALIRNELKLKNLSLVVVDEQHRFGVSQRTTLAKNRAGFIPHFLTMSATPIPRSLALTVFGNLDLTVIDQMPPGRKPVKTYVVPSQKRRGVTEFVKKEIAKDHQAFIVCPLIEESESLTTVKAAVSEFEKLKNTSFAKIPIDLLHGRMKSVDKEKVLSKFAKGETKILVSTAVVEVGIDVQAATVMIIEGADRFGLAQLHQLRGRVGRATDQAYCFLLTDNFSGRVRQRLAALVRETDGAKLAEIDLALRGPGEFFGTAQHGFKRLRLAKLSDVALISTARNWAKKILETDPNLARHRKLAEVVKESISGEITLS